MSVGTREVEVGAEVVNEAGTAFQYIAVMSEKTADMMKAILSTIQQLAGGSEEIVASVKEIDRLSETTAGEAQTVSAAKKEQLASILEIASASQSLAVMAQELQEGVSKFKIG